jgi:RNA polymerase sigma-70 factor (ECF subfamily)
MGKQPVPVAVAADLSQVPLCVVPAGPSSDPTDAELGRALKAGLDWAPAATWNRFAPLVFGIVRRALGSQNEAEDVTQEVFFHLFARVGTLRDPLAFRSFVVSFALRIVKWELRRRRARRWLTLTPSSLLPETAALDSDPESREVLRRFYLVLDQLAARDRLAFALRYLESMTLEEIAATLEVSLSTVKRNLNRAAARVTRWIASDPDLVTFFEGRRRDNDSV